jgi:hypothetical protein
VCNVCKYDLSGCDETSLQVFQCQVKDTKTYFDEDIKEVVNIPLCTIADLLVVIGFCTSKSEARRKCNEGAVYVDYSKCTNILETRGGEILIKIGYKEKMVIVTDNVLDGFVKVEAYSYTRQPSDVGYTLAKKLSEVTI